MRSCPSELVGSLTTTPVNVTSAPERWPTMSAWSELTSGLGAALLVLQLGERELPLASDNSRCMIGPLFRSPQRHFDLRPPERRCDRAEEPPRLGGSSVTAPTPHRGRRR